MLQETTSILTEIPRSLGNDLDSLNRSRNSRILIVDDDPDYVSMMKLILRQVDFDVSGVLNYRDALEKCMELRPDVILLDLMMPEKDGYATFQMLREVTNSPILIVSAAPRADNLSRALDLGADDYISKPFHNSEIIARLKKILRQIESSIPINAYYFPEVGLRIDLDSRTVLLNGKTIPLLPREFSLLKLLAEYAPRNVSYESITQKLLGEDTRRTRANLKNIAFGLRRKLELDPGKPQLLINNRSIGYQLITKP